MASERAAKVPPHVNEILTEFSKYLPHLQLESPRGQALVAVSYLDELLKRTLLAFFVDDRRHSELVDDGNAPIATFSSRIRMSEALGLITKQEASELDRIRKIRNRFSHEIHVSFEDQQVQDLCKAFNFGNGIKGAQEARGIFTTVTTTLILRLAQRPWLVAKARCIPKDWT